jgi:tRNA (adenine-N(1)-)-methyltransferase non-catalytic subunit
VSLGKYGNFPSNQIIDRPFYLTYEILDKPLDDGHILRVVPATELHAEALISEGSGEADGVPEDLELGYEDDLPRRTNRETLDEPSSQKLTLEEIEELKKQSVGAGKEIISRLLESHSAIDQKTAFSLAKYKIRKERKYLRRFTVLPMDVNFLTHYMLEEKDPARIMELRDELVGLIGCWGNVHRGGDHHLDDTISKPNGRYLVVDDTGGLLVAAMAERMGILHPFHPEEEEEQEEEEQEEQKDDQYQTTSGAQQATEGKSLPRRKQGMTASANTITLIHPYAQPNLSILNYFGYDQNASSNDKHPLHTHLKTLSWLQLLEPQEDHIYAEVPPTEDQQTLDSYKPSKRGNYYRKRGRYERVRSVVDETRAGGFDGLIVATQMDPPSVLQHAVPLLAGGAQVVVYSPAIEPLVHLADLYSTARRTAFIKRKSELAEKREQQKHEQQQKQHGDSADDEDGATLTSEFPLDPSLLLGPTLQTSRVRHWQVLPGRTHPEMSGRGGAEGYIFHATRVIPASTRVAARGTISKKKRKVDTGASTPTMTT